MNPLTYGFGMYHLMEQLRLIKILRSFTWIGMSFRSISDWNTSSFGGLMRLMFEGTQCSDFTNSKINQLATFNEDISMSVM